MKATLQPTLTPLMLWGLGVGYVISGMYFGWNFGLHEGGTLGLAIATFCILIMYITFSMSYSELACSIPKAGGVFDYAQKAFGKKIGFVAGMAQWVEFVFAPPAIALGIGAYFHLLIPEVPAEWFALAAYLTFTVLNVLGVKISASFELIITIIAVAELSLFAALTLPHFEWNNLAANSFPHGFAGAFAAIPFAIWFFLGMEGLANVAEETINPQKNLTKGFAYSMVTLAILAIITFCSAVGVGGWEKVVYDEWGNKSDSPLPMALAQITGKTGFFYHSLVSIGLFGFVASFNGLLLAAGRATYELGKCGNFPRVFADVHPRFKTPHKALWLNMGIGVIALFSGKTSEIITLAVFGAVTMYIFACLSLFALRKKEPELHRPFLTPAYPYFPAIALVIASVALAALVFYYPVLAAVFAALMLLSFLLLGNRR
jgi:ethanolamine permease